MQISLAHFFVFHLPSKLRVVHIRKIFKIFIFSKMVPTIFIKFCGFIVHSNPNNMALSAFPEKIAELILQPFRHFTYVTAHSPIVPSLYLHRSSFSNHFVASPTSQLILQPFCRFSYVTSSSLTYLASRLCFELIHLPEH